MNPKLFRTSLLIFAGLLFFSCLSTDPFTASGAGTSSSVAAAVSVKAAEDPPVVKEPAVVPQCGHSLAVMDLVYSPDGKLLATAGKDGLVKLWRTSDGVLVRDFAGHGGVVTCLAFTPEGKSVVSGSLDGTARLWRIEDGLCLKVFDFHGPKPKRKANPIDPPQQVLSLDISPDGKCLAATLHLGESDLFLYDLVSRELRDDFLVGAELRAVRFTKDGKYVLAATAGNVWDEKERKYVFKSGDYIRIYDISRPGSSLMHEFPVSGSCCDMRFSPDGKYFGYLGSSKNSQLTVWSTGKEGLPGFLKREIRDGYLLPWAKTDAVAGNMLGFSKDSSKVFCTSRALQAWDLENGKKVLENFYSDSPKRDSSRPIPLGGCTLSPDGKTLAVPDSSVVYFADLGSGKNLSWISPTPLVRQLAWSRDGKVLAASSNEGTVWLWDGEGGRLLRRIAASRYWLRTISLNREGTKLATLAADGTLKVWDCAGGKLLATFGGGPGRPDPGSGYASAIFAPDGNIILGHGSEGAVAVWDPVSGLMEREFTLFKLKGYVSPADVSSVSDDGLVATLCLSHAYLWNYKDGKIVYDEPFGADPKALYKGQNVFSISISADGDSLMTIASGGGLYSLAGVQRRPSKAASFIPDRNRFDSLGDALGKDAVFAAAITDIRCSPDGRWVLLGKGGGDLKLKDGCPVGLYEYPTKDAKAIYKREYRRAFIGHTAPILSVAANPDCSRIASASMDGTVRIWNAATEGSLALVMRGSEWIAYDKKGYFDASRNGGGLAGLSLGPESYRIDQFAAKYNRPDIVLAEAGLGTKSQLEHYRKQYERRLAKLGLDEKSLGPESKVPRAKIERLDRRDREVALRIGFEGSDSDLKSYSVYVNDVPLFGAGGKPLSGKKAEVDEKLLLDPGVNKIEVSCLSGRGVESYRDFRFEEYKEQVKGDLYFLGFGVSDYKDPAIPDLVYAHKDILDLESLFKAMKGQFKAINTKVLVNGDVTAKNIAAAKDFFAKAKPEDTAVLAISGHGLHDRDARATYYFLTSDARLAALNESAADFELVEDLLMGIAPRNKLFLMDTCESGEPDERSLKAAAAFAARGRGVAAKSTRGIQVTGSSPAPAAPTGGTRSYLNDTDRFIYADLARRSGAIVFSSCRGGEVSFEDGTVKNGYFTKGIIDAFAGKAADANGDGVVDTDELRSYVARTVAEKTEGAQNPTVDRDNIYQKFFFPAGGVGR